MKNCQRFSSFILFSRGPPTLVPAAAANHAPSPPLSQPPPAPRRPYHAVLPSFYASSTPKIPFSRRCSCTLFLDQPAPQTLFLPPLGVWQTLQINCMPFAGAAAIRFDGRSERNTGTYTVGGRVVRGGFKGPRSTSRYVRPYETD